MLLIYMFFDISVGLRVGYYQKLYSYDHEMCPECESISLQLCSFVEGKREIVCP